MTDTLTYDLGEYRGRQYLLRGRADPADEQPDDFSVTVYYKDASQDEHVEIARVDTAHEYTHFDQLYRRDEPKEDVDWGYWEAVKKLMENWRTYAKNYDSAHG